MFKYITIAVFMSVVAVFSYMAKDDFGPSTQDAAKSASDLSVLFAKNFTKANNNARKAIRPCLDDLAHATLPLYVTDHAAKVFQEGLALAKKQKMLDDLPTFMANYMTAKFVAKTNRNANLMERRAMKEPEPTATHIANLFQNMGADPDLLPACVFSRVTAGSA